MTLFWLLLFSLLLWFTDTEHALIQHNLTSYVRSVRDRVCTIGGIMQQLENLGARATAQPSGLNVELLDFQCEVLGWAMQRENAPLGLQSFLWSRIPKISIFVSGKAI